MYTVTILSFDNKVLLKTKLIGDKIKMEELGSSFFNIISSIEPEKYKTAKVTLEKV